MADGGRLVPADACSVGGGVELERAVALVAGELAGISHRARSRVTLGDVAALSGDVADGIVQPVEIKVRLLLCAQRNILEGKDGD